MVEADVDQAEDHAGKIMAQGGLAVCEAMGARVHPGHLQNQPIQRSMAAQFQFGNDDKKEEHFDEGEISLPK